MFYKRARVEYVPLGVVGAIVPWNYPFHNIFNPLTAALFAGNACVIKVGAWRGRLAGCAMLGGALCGAGCCPECSNSRLQLAAMACASYMPILPPACLQTHSHLPARRCLSTPAGQPRTTSESSTPRWQRQAPRQTWCRCGRPPLAWPGMLRCPAPEMPFQGALLPPILSPSSPSNTPGSPLSVHLPRPALQIVTGYGEAGQALVTSPGVGKLIFVGSTQIGRKVGIFFVFVAVAVWGCVGSAQISCKVRLCGPCQSGCVWLCGVL